MKDRLEIIRTRAKLAAYSDRDAVTDLNYLLAVIDGLERLWEAHRIAMLDPDNEGGPSDR